MRKDLNCKSISSLVVALVVAIVILAAGAGYFVIYGSGTVTSTSRSVLVSPLILYSADSQVNEAARLEAAFTTQTGIPMATPVDAGAGTLASDISAGDPVSVFLSVSRTSLESPALGAEFPGWAVAFASDQVGIAYTTTSSQTQAGRTIISAYVKASTTNTTQAWFNFFYNLTSGVVKVGISNPNADPGGFRAWMVLELAGISYDGGVANEQYFVNRMLTNQGNVTGASSAALVPALLTGQIQFLFYYKSAITSAGLNLMQLPNGINLALPSYNAYYSQATYKIKSGMQVGSAMLIWLTVPKDSTDPTDSISFVMYVIQNYQTVLANYGLTPISPAQLYNSTSYTVPAQIVALLNTGTLVDNGPV